MDRTCQRCGKEFAYPSRLREHLNRKTPCKFEEAVGEIDAHVCQRCFRPFKEKRYLTRHLKDRCEVARQEDEPQANVNIAPHVEINGDHNNVNIHVGNKLYQINFFSQPDLSVVTPVVLKDAFDMSGGSSIRMMEQIMRKIYQSPENMNAYLKDDSVNSMALILEKTKTNEAVWNATSQKGVYTPMVDNAANAFFKDYSDICKVEGMTEPLKQRVDEIWRELRDLCPDDEGLREKIIDEVREMGRIILIGNREQLRKSGII